MSRSRLIAFALVAALAAPAVPLFAGTPAAVAGHADAAETLGKKTPKKKTTVAPGVVELAKKKTPKKK